MKSEFRQLVGPLPRRLRTGAPAVFAAVSLTACFPVTTDYFQPDSPDGKVLKAMCHGTIGPPSMIRFSHGDTWASVMTAREEQDPGAVRVDVMLFKLPIHGTSIEIAAPVLAPDDGDAAGLATVPVVRLDVTQLHGRAPWQPLPDNSARISYLKSDAFLSYHARIGAARGFTLVLPRIVGDEGSLVMPAQTIHFTLKRITYSSPINC